MTTMNVAEEVLEDCRSRAALRDVLRSEGFTVTAEALGLAALHSRQPRMAHSRLESLADGRIVYDLLHRCYIIQQRENHAERWPLLGDHQYERYYW